MCRLGMITMADESSVMRRLVTNQLMLLSNLEMQNDGAGITDGLSVRKSARPYAQFGAEWLRMFDPDRIWLTHVRSASRNTNLTSYEAHPFVLPLAPGRALFATHNGTIKDTEKLAVWGKPVSDSWREFNRLSQMMGNGVEISADLLNTWTAGFAQGSEWTFMFTEDGLTAHIARGHRAMYALPVNDGFIFNTSKDVLINLKAWMLEYWESRFTMGVVAEIPPFTLTSVAYGSEQFEQVKLSEPPKEFEVGDRYYVYTPKGAEVFRKY